jgi:perosamine synthetase
MIPIYKPYLNKESLKYAHDALDSTWVSSHGKYLNIVSDKLKELNNSKHVILTSNGTTATHLMSIGLKYKRPTVKNIIVPNNVYIAAWNSFKIKPDYNLIPLDCDLDTWNTNYDDIWQHLECDERLHQKDIIDYLDGVARYNSNDTAFLIVHNIGNIVDVPKLKRKYSDYIFVEDNCEGFLGKYGEKPSGSESLMSSVSFFGNKTITSGEGGAIFTDDENVYNHLNSVKSHGMTEFKFVFDKLVYNYRITNVQAAILLGQIESINTIKEKKSKGG